MRGVGMSRWTTRARVASAAMLSTVVLLGAACGPQPGTPTTVPGPDTGPPTISNFAAARTSGPAPLTTAFTWTVTDPDAQQLICTLDFDGDDFFEVTVPTCTSASVRSATFATPGSHTAKLRVTDGTTVVTSDLLALTVGPAVSDAFGITFRLNGTMTSSQQATFTTAAARWSQVIRSGLSDVSLSIPADDCGTGAPAFSGPIDDLLIDASITAIDGPGGILGQAGPCYIRTTGGLPVYGIMQFDVADVAALEASGGFESVILHEMGHVLGFGTVWQSLVNGLGTSNPTFVGLTARGTWSWSSSANTSVPVEGGGGAGTAGSHWRESSLGNELMTGYLNSGPNPLSKVTIGALSDLGYGVDLAAADPFAGTAVRAPEGPATQLHTELITPKGTVG